MRCVCGESETRENKKKGKKKQTKPTQGFTKGRDARETPEKGSSTKQSIHASRMVAICDPAKAVKARGQRKQVQRLGSGSSEQERSIQKRKQNLGFRNREAATLHPPPFASEPRALAPADV